MVGQFRPNNIKFVVGDMSVGVTRVTPAGPPPSIQHENPKIQSNGFKSRHHANEATTTPNYLDFYLKKLCVDYFSSKL